jgi:hypothetical protein
MEYLSTYWTILGLGDWWVAPGCSAVDKPRESEAAEESPLKTYDFIYQTRSGKTRFKMTRISRNAVSIFSLPGN